MLFVQCIQTPRDVIAGTRIKFDGFHVPTILVRMSRVKHRACSFTAAATRTA